MKTGGGRALFVAGFSTCLLHGLGVQGIFTPDARLEEAT